MYLHARQHRRLERRLAGELSARRQVDAQVVVCMADHYSRSRVVSGGSSSSSSSAGELGRTVEGGRAAVRRRAAYAAQQIPAQICAVTVLQN